MLVVAALLWTGRLRRWLRIAPVDIPEFFGLGLVLSGFALALAADRFDLFTEDGAAPVAGLLVGGAGIVALAVGAVLVVVSWIADRPALRGRFLRSRLSGRPGRVPLGDAHQSAEVLTDVSWWRRRPAPEFRGGMYGAVVMATAAQTVDGPSGPVELWGRIASHDGAVMFHPLRSEVRGLLPSLQSQAGSGFSLPASSVRRVRVVPGRARLPDGRLERWTMYALARRVVVDADEGRVVLRTLRPRRHAARLAAAAGVAAERQREPMAAG